MGQENQNPESEAGEQQENDGQLNTEEVPDVQIATAVSQEPPATTDEKEPPVPMSPEKRNILLILITASLLLIVSGGYWFFFAGKKEKPPSSTIPTENQATAEEVTSVPEATDESAPPVDQEVVNESVGSPSSEMIGTTKVCESPDLKLVLAIPKQWSCETSEGQLGVEGGIFKIVITSLGRGFFCIDDPNIAQYSPECRITSFFAKRTIDLKLYADSNGPGEVFGMINTPPLNAEGARPWMLITWTDMQTHQLTQEENSQLIDVINSVRLLE